MINSRNRVLAGLLLAASVAFLDGVALGADATAPASAPGNAPETAATPLKPSSGSQPSAALRPDSNGGFSNPFTQIETQSLGVVAADLVGVLDDQNGGFGTDMWSGSKLDVIEAVLPRLPAATSSPAMTDLLRRLLLSKAQPPEGSAVGSLAAIRFDRALAIGEVGAIDVMAGQLPPDQATTGVLGVRVDALLFQGKDSDACALAEKARGNTNDSAAWTKRLGYCSALAGKVAEARLASDILADTGDTDEAFRQLMAKLVDKAKIKPVHIANPSAVHFALLRKTQSDIDDASLANASPAFLTAWAADEKAPLAQRLMAGEHAVSAGVMPVSALIALYSEVKLKPELLAAYFDPGKAPDGAEGAAYVVQRLAKTGDGTERGKLLAFALESGETRGTLPALAKVFQPALFSLPASPSLLDNGAILATGELLAGPGGNPKRWLDLMNSQGEGNSEPARALRSLLAVHGGSSDVAWSADEFLVRVKAAPDADKARAELEWDMLRALGMPSSNPVWLATLAAPLTETGALPTPPIMEGLKAAASAHRVGETAMFALAALGEGGPREAHPTAIAAIVAALDRAGLSSDAHAIATEALAWHMP